ncbi:MAG TPA: tape measure protein, partial [Urbifossiella sp.]|nr:tape measure protein [Urbifossiella sp.]
MAKQTIDEMAIIITANSAKLGPDLNKAKKELDKFAKDAARMPAPPPKPPDMRAHKQAAKEAEEARSRVVAAGGSVLGFAAKVAVTGGAIVALEAGIGGVASAFGQLKDSVRMAAELEQTRLGFEVMLGDAREATRLVADVRKYAAATPFNTRELTGATRQLVAYGRSADTAMQDLKMLGDVSAAFGDSLPINELVYLYGTLYAQQRAFTKDLYQFAGRGIPIWDELAKVTGKTGAELRDMVEDGRIGFAEVEAAFKRMTGEGGRFQNMTARQGQTVAGVLEQMKDGFELLKIEVGQILIEELGIKQAARDLEAFAGRLRENAGEIRPVVKLVGDLAKAGAQLAYEFGRGAIAVGSMNMETFTRAFPGLKAAADSFRQLVIDAQNFKIDEDKLIDFGMDIAEATASTIGAIVDAVSEMWDKAKEKAAPVLRIMERIDAAMRQFENRGDTGAARDVRDVRAAGQAAADGRVGDVFRNLAPGPAVYTNQRPPALQGRQPGDVVNPLAVPPPVEGMHPDRAREEWSAMAAAVTRLTAQVERERGMVAADRLRPVWLQQTEQRLADVRRNQEAFLAGLNMDPTVARRHMDQGDVPPIRAAALPPAAPPSVPASQLSAEDAARAAAIGPAGLFAPVPPAVKSFAQQVREVTAEIRETRHAAQRERREAEAAAAAAAAQRLAIRTAALGPAAVLETPPNPAADRRSAQYAALGGPAGLFRVEPPPIAPDIQALVSDIRKQYDPRRELAAYRAQLDQIQSRGLLGDNTNAFVDRAWRDKLGEVAGKLGIEQGRYQLPEATAVGSAEDARIITAWRTQGAQP